jgi:DNA repair exonuclease SbcCD ATPase subunit
MLTFIDIELKNFLSYGNVATKVHLDRGSVILISGQNGTGKTTLINAVYYTCYGDSLTECNADELINNINNHDMVCTVTFNQAGTGYYKIVRARKTKAGNYVKFYHNPNENEFLDEHEKTLDSTRNTDALIIDTIGIPSDMFKRMVIISAINTSFLNISVAQQSSFMERLFDLHLLADKATILKTHIKATEEQIKDQVTKIDRIKQEQSRLDTQILNAKSKASSFDENKVTQIGMYKSQLSMIESIDLDKERELYDKSVTVKTEVTGIKQQQSTISNQYLKFTQLKDKHEHELVLLKANKCPYCEQQYTNEEKIAQNEQAIDKCEKDINEMLEYLTELDVELSEKSEAHKKIISELSVTNLEELLSIRNKADIIQGKINDLHDSNNVYLEQLAELEQIQLDPCDYESLDKLKSIVEHQQFLLKLLTKKDSFIRKNLLSSNLKFLNQRLEHYLNELELPYRVSFNSNMTADIKYLGRAITFSNLSHGQRSRVNIGLTMAFRDVRQKMCSPVNICCLDEVLDIGLDSKVMSLAIKMLKRKASEDKITMYIVTHKDEISSLFDNVMNVYMENDFSKISFNA